MCVYIYIFRIHLILATIQYSTLHKKRETLKQKLRMS